MNYAELIAKHGMPEARRLWKEAQKAERQARRRERERIRLAGRTAEKSRDALARYNARQFVAWDGEGVTVDGDHRYVLLSGMHGDDYRELVEPDGIKTYDALRFILDFAQETGDAIHVVYGGSYDFNKILRNIPQSRLEKLAAGRAIYFWDIRVEWRMGKYLRLAKKNKDGETVGKSVTIYDVVAFFQCSFVAACDSYLGDNFIRREMVVENKEARAAFDIANLAEIREYNKVELQNLILLMTELKDRLSTVGLRPKAWFGPGAIATTLFQREYIKEYMAESPMSVRLYSARAYFGGRFEPFKFGIMEQPAWQYDINSAYPTALRNVPSLAHGYWREDDEWNGTVEPFGMYRVKWAVGGGININIPGPFPWRDPKGNIFYPTMGETVVWSPELSAALDYAAKTGMRIEVMDAKVFVPDENAPKPFAFVQELYDERRARKAAGDGAEKGLKLALNSMYGKLAQQVGAKQDPETGEWSLPPFHQLEWAGYTTSYCRALILRAMTQSPENIVAVETDAVFSLVPLDLPVTEFLGDWDQTEWESLSYMQSGTYFGTLKGGKEVVKQRGFDKGTITREAAEMLHLEPEVHDRILPASLTRFTGLRLAMIHGMEKWGQWETMQKSLKLMPQGKRVHDRKKCCGDNFGKKAHTTFCPIINIPNRESSISAAFPVAWLNPNPEMHILAEYREMGQVELQDGY